jgi:hypothetical protein
MSVVLHQMIAGPSWLGCGRWRSEFQSFRRYTAQVVTLPANLQGLWPYSGEEDVPAAMT